MADLSFLLDFLKLYLGKIVLLDLEGNVIFGGIFVGSLAMTRLYFVMRFVPFGYPRLLLLIIPLSYKVFPSLFIPLESPECSPVLSYFKHSPTLDLLFQVPPHLIVWPGSTLKG